MKKLVVLVSVLVMVLLMQGCTKSSGGGTLKGEKVPDYSVKIVYDGTALKSYTIDEIKKMPQESFDVDGKTQQGPSMQYILGDNNIKGYSKVTFVGMFKDSITMTKEQVDKGTIFDITNHDTVKLAAKDVNKDKWIKDIAEIKVEK